MAARDGVARRERRLRVLPSGTGGFLRRRAIELAGLLLIAAGLGLIVAALGYQPGDPSLNRAGDGPVGNPLGRAGAYVADIALQSLGLATGLLAALLLFWAWRLLSERRLRAWWLRLLTAVVALLSAATALAALAPPPGWPLSSGLGGFTGSLLLGPLADALRLPAGGLAAAAALLALAAGLYAIALKPAEWRRLAAALRHVARLGGRGAALLLGLLRRLPARARRPAADPATDPAPADRRRGARREPRLKGEPAVTAAREKTAPREAAAELVAPPAPRAAPGRKAQAAGQGQLALADGYQPPDLGLLAAPRHSPGEAALNRDSLEKNARLLEGVLQDFGVRGEIVKVRPGPVVTRYELEPAPGTKTSRVVGLADDVARSMSAISVRVAVVPGSSAIGIELPNARRETVYLRELLGSEAFERAKGNLPIILGKDIGGAPQIVDLARMPHLLIAGTTGSGKSVGLNAMILSLLYRMPPERCRFIMVDPKMLELSVYDNIPHLLAPVVTEPKKAVVALKWAVREMESRYRAMSRLGVRNIDGYNARIEEALRSGEVLTRRVQTGFDPDTGQPVYEEQPFDLEPLPYIVVVVDEMADLMLVAGKDVEAAIQRLAQMARAAGIHLIMATQRPSVDVITGTIKANFPTRISFQVTSRIDSRTILGESGAEHLLGMGDMLHMAHGGRINRVHGPFVSDEEVEKVVAHIKTQGMPSYLESVTEEVGDEPGFEDAGEGGGDDLFDRAVAIVAEHRKASTSFIQRQLQIGYNRAARLVEQMESQGIVGPANHVGKREILLPDRD